MATIKSLELSDIGPFENMSFEFDKQINMFVGPNNCGKSTVLMALAEIAVYPFTIPAKLFHSRRPKFRIAFSATNPKKRSFSGHLPIDPSAKFISDVLSPLGYTAFVPALRLSTDYRSPGPLANKPTKERVTSRVVLNDNGEMHERVFYNDRHLSSIGNSRNKELSRHEKLLPTDPFLVSDESIMQRMVELDYRAYRQKAPNIRSILDKIAQIASDITEGYPVEFLDMAEDKKGLYPRFRTPDGDLSLNQLSQGTQSIIQCVARLVMGFGEYNDYSPSLEEKKGVFIIDEIDAHLHPSWQRRILPAITRALPGIQIFCSTHSPLMLAGLKAGQVQLFSRGSDGKVRVDLNQNDVVGWSVDEILRGYLDIKDPTDIETSNAVRKLAAYRSYTSLSSKNKMALDKTRLYTRERILGHHKSEKLDKLSRALLRR